MFLLFKKNNITKFYSHLHIFTHTTLVKAGHRVQPIFNIIIIFGSAEFYVIADTSRLSFVDVDPKFEEPLISSAYCCLNM